MEEETQSPSHPRAHSLLKERTQETATKGATWLDRLYLVKSGLRLTGAEITHLAAMLLDAKDGVPTKGSCTVDTEGGNDP